MSKKVITIFIISIIVVGGVFFYVGMSYGKSLNSVAQRLNNREGFMPEQNSFNGNRSGIGFVFGEIISKDDQSITVKTQDGGSKIVFYSEGIEMSKNAIGDINDLEVGKFVTVNGSSDQSGNIIAETIQISSEVNFRFNQ
jgi:hypothetical protein